MSTPFLNFSRIICTNFRQDHASGFWGAGLCGWNYRHTFFAVFTELGDPPAWTRDQLEELNARNIEYNGKQYTRYEINRERSQQLYGDPETYLYMHNAGYTDVERGERGSTEEHLTVTQFKVQREQERLDSLTAQADQKAQSLAKTSQTLSKKEKELAAVQKKATLTKEALIHARDLDYIGKRTFLGNYSLTEEEFSKLKKQADHGYMMDVENRRLKEELSTAKKEAIHWSNKYHDLWYDVKPYLDALHRAPELVRGFLEKILAPKQERTMNVPQKNRKRGQDMEL